MNQTPVKDPFAVADRYLNKTKPNPPQVKGITETDEARRIVKVWFDLFEVRLNEDHVSKHLETLKRWERELNKRASTRKGGGT